MASRSHSTHYHVVVFDRVEEAAAFVAAFSQYLAATRDTDTEPTAPAPPVEVWAMLLANDGGAEVYLSDGALAATAGFASPVIAGGRSAHEVELTATHLIADGDLEVYESDDIMFRLTRVTPPDLRA